MSQINIKVSHQNAIKLSAEFTRQGSTRNTVTLKDGVSSMLLTLVVGATDASLKIFTGPVVTTGLRAKLTNLLSSTGVLPSTQATVA